MHQLDTLSGIINYPPFTTALEWREGGRRGEGGGRKGEGGGLMILETYVVPEELIEYNWSSPLSISPHLSYYGSSSHGRTRVLDVHLHPETLTCT